jgi:hypothetical protein
MLLRTRVALLSVGVALAVLGTPLRDAGACGGFFGARDVAEGRLPSLSYEQTLIVYDRQAHHENFVREVAFRRSRDAFGFVVPVPSRPDVASFGKDVFFKLGASFPFVRPGPPPHAMAATASLEDRGGVDVLEVKQVGSFKAFVLAARDARALSTWLADNALVTTPASDAWLRHYVSLGFYYVAMRYDPPRGAGDDTTSEVMRISFDSPAPYYPYLEPEHGDARTVPRMMDLWLVSDEETVPVASQDLDGASRWVRPLLAGATYRGARPALAEALGVGATILPVKVDLVVQRFADQKRSRAGFGDIVFVPNSADGGASDAALTRFVPLIDPSAQGRP